jgi:hypothetical protein
MSPRILSVLTLTQLAVLATAQVPPALPYSRTQDLLVVDTTYDGIWRFTDFNQVGDYADPGEITSFYSDVLGAYAWSTPTAIVSAPDGTVYVTEISNDAIYALRDLNGDGDANDPGEHTVFFDGTNLSGFPIPQAYGITADALGRLFLAVNNASTPAGPDRILKLEDLNGDGDAQDLNEAIDYYNLPGTTGALANSIPTKVVVGPDGSVYYTEAGTVFTKGVWKLTDGNSNGNCNDPGEATLFWTPPFSTSPQYWALGVDAAGFFYVTDHASGNEKVWRGSDANANGTIEPGEQTLFYQTGGSSWWDLAVRDDGTVLLVDSDTPDKITALRDLDADGDALDLGESAQAYQSGSASVAVAVRGACLQRAPRLEVSPATVPIGNATTVVTRVAKPLDLCVSVIALGLGPQFPLAPWGTVEIDVSVFVSIGAGFADTAGYFSVPFSVPNDPAVIGTYAFQSLAGDLYRLFLSNAAVMTVTP